MVIKLKGWDGERFDAQTEEEAKQIAKNYLSDWMEGKDRIEFLKRDGKIYKAMVITEFVEDTDASIAFYRHDEKTGKWWLFPPKENDLIVEAV